MTLNKKSNWGGVSYESPSVKTLDIVSEGVLCASTDPDATDWVEGQNGWFTE